MLYLISWCDYIALNRDDIFIRATTTLDDHQSPRDSNPTLFYKIVCCNHPITVFLVREDGVEPPNLSGHIYLYKILCRRHLYSKCAILCAEITNTSTPAKLWYPRSDSNRHWTASKTAASANWATRASYLNWLDVFSFKSWKFFWLLYLIS